MDRIDPEIIQRARNGDPSVRDAFCLTCVEWLTPHIQKKFGGYLDGPDEATGIAWEAAIKAFGALAQYQDDNFEGWLFTIVRNLILDQKRKREGDPLGASGTVWIDEGRETEEGETLLQELPDHSPLQDADLELKQEEERTKNVSSLLERTLREAFVDSEKTPSERNLGWIKINVFKMFYIDGATQKEMAQIFRLPQSTINNWTSGGRLFHLLIDHLLNHNRPMLERLPRFVRTLPTLSADERSILAQRWPDQRLFSAIASEVNKEETEVIAIYDQARKKILSALVEEIKKELHETRKKNDRRAV